MNKNAFNTYSLKFPDHTLEKRYLNYIAATDLQNYRTGLGLGIVTFMVFGVVEALLNAETIQKTLWIRLVVVLPFLLIIFRASFLKSVIEQATKIQFLAMFAILITHIGQTAVFVVGINLLPPYYLIAVSNLLLFFLFLFAGIQFQSSFLIACILTTSSFLISVWAIEDTNTLLFNGITLFSAFSIGLFAGYLFERVKRLDFLKLEKLTEQNAIIEQQKQEIVKVNSQRIEKMLDNALDAFIAINQHQEIIEWSERSVEIFGWTKQEAIGQKLATLIIPEKYTESHHQGFGRFMSSRNSRIMEKVVEIEAVRKNGEIFPVELILTYVEFEGEMFINAFIRDVTEKRRAELELKRTQDAYIRSVEEKQKIVEEQNEVLEQQVHQRTLELQDSIHELNQTNEALNKAYEEIHYQHTRISESINYARHIQNAILPQRSEIVEV